MAGGAAKTLPEVIRKALEVFSADLHVGIPARIEKFDASTGLADVKPLVKDVDPDGVSRSVPVVTNVPVHFPGAGGFRMTFPVKPGDPCFLLFSDRSLDVWLSKGGEVDPVDPRRHALSDAVAILGITDAIHPWKNVSTSKATIGHDGAGPRIEFGPSDMVLDGGSSGVATAGDACTFVLSDGNGKPCTGTIQIGPNSRRVKA